MSARRRRHRDPRCDTCYPGVGYPARCVCGGDRPSLPPVETAPAEHACYTCRYWRPQAPGRTGPVGGTCHRRAPVRLSAGDRVDLWPYTGPIDWCGEWRPERPRKRGG